MKRKNIGLIFLILALLFINPIPTGVDDVVPLYFYSLYSGVDIGMDNLSSIYLDYVIWSTIVGLILLFVAMYYLNWSWSKLFRKLNLGKYNLAIGLAILVVLSVAIFDIWSMNSGIFGNISQYTNGDFQVVGDWWGLFFKFVLILFLIVPICYWFFVRKDFSECIGIFGASMIMFFGGLSDVAFFIFQKVPIPDVLPHLNNHPFIGWISTTLGFEAVTNVSLLISVGVSFLLTYLFVRVLKERF